MSAKVSQLPVMNNHTRILREAKDKTTGVIVIGYTTEGQLFFQSSYADGGQILWLMEQAKLQLLKSGEP